MRALTGYDRVTLTCGDRRAENSRGVFGGSPDLADLPIMLADTDAGMVNLFPRERNDMSAQAALMRAPKEADRQELSGQGIRSMLRIPFDYDGVNGEFCCESRSPRQPSFELHAAAELFAQMFAMRVAIDMG